MSPTTFTESVVEEAALDCLHDDLGYAIAHGEEIAPDGPLLSGEVQAWESEAAI